MEQAIREDVPALAVGGELDLIHREEVDRSIRRHRLDRADPIVGARRQALLLPRHQRDPPLAHPSGHPVVDLASEQAERQPDDARVVLEHALDGAVGLPRIGGPQLRHDDGRAAG
jgi:hypothetical protein